MKRVCSFLLAFLLMVFLFVVPLSAYASQETLKPKAVTGLSITTSNKKKLLRITWDQQKKADGYQVYRSTTGKSGSFKRIATISKNSYIDKGLKASVTYYYFCEA